MPEEIIMIISALFILIVGLIIEKKVNKITIYDYEKGVRFHKGKFHDLVGPGRYTYFKTVTSWEVFDIRQSVMQINGQEILSSDNVNVKISLAVKYKITDPQLLISQYKNYYEYLYVTIQFKLREVVSSLEIDEVLKNRNTISERIRNLLFEDKSLSGLIIHSVDLKDIMLTGDIKKVYAEAIKVKKEALVSLEKARGEMATLRCLANAAKMLEKNPELVKLRIIQTIESTQGNTFIVDSNYQVGEVREKK